MRHFVGTRYWVIMTDYDGPMKMLQPKTYTSLTAFCGKDGSSAAGLSADLWNTGHRMQVRLSVFADDS